jgi:hypothetical protein
MTIDSKYSRSVDRFGASAIAIPFQP